ncbi:anthranilate synthase component II [Reinekea blandensis]|uniref:Glutamine amidotransferase of anthranilate synthase or para-aminobenzoate synthase n=1 Tax=Reinekea blandensis MED297 TaxID=314283 RepID=A4BEX0_9GAMM|nr:aminodeoxychorismate/anthranilate synthase component II [Reinekea blandensis]EAR09305.1 glutamine amidotransferase of anthranilate synthase or para-aminobenzoate synthase [Reinekea sp. MED297] [Reinekea blandensis MED297]
MLLMIDNYDSFTYTLVNYLESLDVEVLVKKNDAIDVAGIRQLSPDFLMISPGPCTPNEAGISLEAIRVFAGELPIFGVCLGHQAIGQVFGAQVVQAKSIMHGKVSSVWHDSLGVFDGLPSPFSATRYHSLVLDEASLPASLEVTAWTCFEDGTREEIMGIRHQHMMIEGVQFHPESVMTEHGLLLLKNFIDHYRAAPTKAAQET